LRWFDALPHLSVLRMAAVVPVDEV
jgi:hypothetical protein